jgi:hypothetical protein
MPGPAAAAAGDGLSGADGLFGLAPHRFRPGASCPARKSCRQAFRQGALFGATDAQQIVA